MSSLWTGMLLLHGHIHDLELVRRLANMPRTSPPRKSGGKRQCRVSSKVPVLPRIPWFSFTGTEAILLSTAGETP